MTKDLDAILEYLKMNKKCSFRRRTKALLKQCTSQMVFLDAHLSQLSKDGYIRSYMHPDIGLHDTMQIEEEKKVFYSVTDRGIRFLNNGGYQFGK